MLCIAIKGPAFEDVVKQISLALKYADLIELRLDYFIDIDEAALKQLRSMFSIPMIFTLRDKSQGGHYSGPEEARLADIRRFAALKPEYLDLESHIPTYFFHEITSGYPEIKLIISYHDFEKTSKRIDLVYQEIKKNPAHFYKIAMKAETTLDAFRMILFLKKSDKNVIAMSMGAEGQLTRILGPIFGNPITYASLEDSQKTAPGQVTAQELVELYHYRSLNADTAIYGLIGDPVDRSISEKTHNPLMVKFALNAIYIKMRVIADELAEFFQYAKELPFRGLSVTMPLKEKVIFYLNEIDVSAREIGAVNTLLFEGDRIVGFNTDASGALNALETQFSVKGKKIVVVGAGGAAKAIVYEACRRGGI